MIPTIRVRCEPCEGNPHGVVTINITDFNPDLHEPNSQEDVDALRSAVPGGANLTFSSSKLAELQGLNEDLMARAAALDTEAARQTDQASELDAERLRLAQMRADLDVQASELKMQRAAQDAESARLSAEVAKRTESTSTKSKPSKPE